MPIREIRHPLIRHKLGLMRRADISTKNFRELAQEVGALLTYEATNDLPLENYEIQGWNGTVSPAFKPREMFSISLAVGRHSPAITGRPSGPRGAGAFRSARPSRVRGMPGVGTFSHCPVDDWATSNSSNDATIAVGFIGALAAIPVRGRIGIGGEPGACIFNAGSSSSSSGAAPTAPLS